MARYRGTIQGSRGEASRLGTPKSGLRVEANGWTAGVRVEAYPVKGTKEDRFYIESTGGSNALRASKPFAKVESLPEGGQEITVYIPEGVEVVDGVATWRVER